MSEKRIKNVRSVLPNQDKFIEYRQKLGWTQQYAAQQTGYSERLIRKIEGGGRARAQTLVDVARCYDQALRNSNLPSETFLLDESGNGSTSKTEQYVSLFKEFYKQLYQERNIGSIEKMISPNIRFTSEGTIRYGRAIVNARAQSFLNAFNDIKFDFDRAYCQKSSVVSYWTASMVHVGEFAGIPATNLKVRVRGNTLAVFVSSMIVEAEDQFDLDDLIRQLSGKIARIL